MWSFSKYRVCEIAKISKRCYDKAISKAISSIMSNSFEQSGAEGGKTSIEHGRFTPMAEEIEQIRKSAIAEGGDPEEAQKAYEEKMAKATGNLREKQSEKAGDDLKKALEKGA